MTKRERLYPEIKRLREEECLKWREVGERVGLSLKTAYDYYSDPTGVTHRARLQKSYASRFRACAKCGGRACPDGDVRLCMACHVEDGKVARRCRLEDVAVMYREGMSYREIARELGYAPSSIPPEIGEARSLGLIGYRYKACERRLAA